MSANFLNKYKSIGCDKFYRYLLVYAINKLILIDKGEYKGISPELELIQYYEKFLSQYRRDGDIEVFRMAKTFRKAANKIYRVMMKKNLIQKNIKFLNVV